MACRILMSLVDENDPISILLRYLPTYDYLLLTIPVCFVISPRPVKCKSSFIATFSLTNLVRSQL